MRVASSFDVALATTPSAAALSTSSSSVATKASFETVPLAKRAGTPEDAAQVVEKAIVSASPRVRYPVSAKPPLTQRQLLSDRAWDCGQRHDGEGHRAPAAGYAGSENGDTEGGAAWLPEGAELQAQLVELGVRVRVPGDAAANAVGPAVVGAGGRADEEGGAEVGVGLEAEGAAVELAW